MTPHPTAARRMPITVRQTASFLAALAVGTTIGLMGWSAHQRRARRSLFSPHPTQRFAALGYLRAHPSVDSARLLRDYLDWEPHGVLRRRARTVLRRTERLLRS